MRLRIGHGYDIHRLVEGRKLVLGGVRFDTTYGLEGHSDADCLTHAVCDALLGAAGLPDIGHFFPNTETRWRDANSQDLLRRVSLELANSGWKPVNIDISVIAERPKIGSSIPQMKQALAATLGLSTELIGIKATTNEGIDDIGQGLAIAAHAVVLIEKA
jgi:2-C-methyl-D-erythritol 2,4-cyclodiphosphate synthase